MTSANSCPAIATEKMSAAIEFGLLPDIWEQIFKMLDFPNLRSVRSTCHRWKQIVDGSSAIMDQWRVKINEQEIDRDFQPSSVVPARSAKLTETRLSCIGPWWTLLGENLMDLNLDECQISTRMLLKLLQQTPNLKSLKYLSNYPVTDICTKGICLNKLERLAVGSSDGDTLDFFRKICPQVKSFSAFKTLEKTKLTKYLEASNEIEELHLNYYGYLKDVLEIRKIMQLKHVTSLKIENIQPCTKIGDVFPELKSFSFECGDDLRYKAHEFLNKMEKLEKLSIHAWRNFMIDFSAFKPQPNLREINFTYVDLGHKSMYQFLQDFSPFCRFTFTNCVNISTVFATIEQMDSFEYLSLESIDMYEIPSEYLDSLKCLKLRKVDTTKQLLGTLFKLCPQLKEIELIVRVHYKHIDDDVMQVICEKLKHLETLTIENCSFTDQSVEHIVNNCTELRWLKIVGNHTMSDDGRRKLSRYINGLHPSNCRVEIVKIPV